MTTATPFSQAIESYWQDTFLGSEVLYRNNALTVSVKPDLDENRRVMLLKTAAGQCLAVCTPALAQALGLNGQLEWSEPLLRQRLVDHHVALHGADYLFHFTEDCKQALLQEPLPAHVRQLGAVDAAVFAEFQSSASEKDMDDAYVELDHWAVFGVFEHDRLVCAASMYPWEDQQIADTGVLTLPSFRGKGYARQVVHAISRHACQLGYEPQYRCQTDNVASVSLAKAAGLSLFGTWEVVSPESVG
jgi:RimJ/RimL family protein N-acetyltransferase